MNEEQLLTTLKETGAMLEGHFQLTSGLHSDKYVQCAKLLQHPEHAEKVGQALAAKFDVSGKKICVVGLALGGIIVGYEIARALGVRSLFAERKDGVMQIRRGFQIEPGEHVILAEDVITTGGSVLEVKELLSKQGHKIEGIASMVYRGSENPPFDCKYEYLTRISAVTYAPDKCPLCAKNVPVYKPGSRGS